MANQLRFIRKVVYRLKKRYGLKTDYYIVGENVIDEQTGFGTLELTKISIKRVVRLPDIVARQYQHLGAFDRSKKNFLLDSRDMPNGFEPNIEDYFVVGQTRYNIEDYTSLEFNQGFWLVGKATEGENPGRVLDLSTLTVLEAGNESSVA